VNTAGELQGVLLTSMEKAELARPAVGLASLQHQFVSSGHMDELGSVLGCRRSQVLRPEPRVSTAQIRVAR